MRAVAAQHAQVVGAERERRVVQQRLHVVVRQLVPLEVEEQELGLQLGAALAHLLHQRAALGSSVSSEKLSEA